MLPYIQVNWGLARWILAHGEWGVARLMLAHGSGIRLLDLSARREGLARLIFSHEELERLILTCLRSTDSYCIFLGGAQELACMDLHALYPLECAAPSPAAPSGTL